MWIDYKGSVSLMSDTRWDKKYEQRIGWNGEIKVRVKRTQSDYSCMYMYIISIVTSIETRMEKSDSTETYVTKSKKEKYK